jgi:hypothetical protein
MNAEVEDWGENRFGVLLSLNPKEVDQLIANLRVLQKDSDQHFHFEADSTQRLRLGDIEIGVQAPGQPHNMRITSLALAPGTELPDRTSRRTPSKGNPVRSRLMWAFWSVAIVAGLGATYAATVTLASSDYRPLLIGGVWASAVALLALHGTTLTARGWKGRVPGIVAVPCVLYVLSEILRRLSAK